MTLRAMLAGAFTPGRASHARQVKGEKSEECSKNLVTMTAGRQLSDALAEDQFYIDNGMDHLL